MLSRYLGTEDDSGHSADGKRYFCAQQPSMRFLARDEARIAELAFFTTHPPFFRVILFYRTALGIDIARWQGGGSSPKQGKRRRIPGC